MLKLSDTSRITVTLAEGAKVILRAPTPAIIAAGRRAVRKAHDEDADLDPALALIAFSEGVLGAAIEDWEGIGSPDGTALECNPVTIAAALADIHVFDRLDAEYVIPITAREREKNASAVSSAGISAGATAETTTAGSAAATARGKNKPKAKTSSRRTGSKAKPRKAAKG